MRILDRLKKLQHLPNNVVSLSKIIMDPRVSSNQKMLFLMLSGGYFIWPYDFMFDVPFIGQLDDLGVFLLLLTWFMSRIPDDIKYEHGWRDM